MDILHAHNIFGIFIVNFVNLSYLLLGVSIVNIKQVMACNGEFHATMTKYFGVQLHTGSVFFIDRPVYQLYLVKSQYSLFRLWFFAIYNEAHLSLVEAHLYLTSSIFCGFTRF